MHFFLKIILWFCTAVFIAALWSEFLFKHKFGVNNSILIDKLAKWKIIASELSGMQLVLHHFTLLNSISDKFFGRRLFSLKSIKMSAYLAASFLLLSILSTLIWKQSFLVINPNPTSVIESVAEISRTIIKNPTERGKVTAEEFEKLKPFYEFLSKLDKFEIKWGYMAAFIIFCWIWLTLINSFSIALSRQFLREVVHSKGSVTLFAGFAFISLAIVLVSSVSLFIIGGLTIPFLGALLFTGIPLSAYFSVYLAIWLYFTTILVFWVCASLWLKAIVILPIYPLFIIGVSLIVSLLMYPVRARLYEYLNFALVQCIESKLGSTLFITALLTVITTTVLAIAALT